MDNTQVIDQFTADHLARWCITQTFVAADRAAMVDSIVAFLAAAPDAAARKNLLHMGWPTLYRLARDTQGGR